MPKKTKSKSKKSEENKTEIGPGREEPRLVGLQINSKGHNKISAIIFLSHIEN
jgi:hypothetical protein